ncbi:MAG: hypothetical protein M9891_11120 [Austwickia sp.]|nr:hypothetical protein [Actinomycetota bacterium]MCO5309821.1 hypothetical protein [Austwickia sp.]
MTQPPGPARIPLSRLQLQHPMSLSVFEDYERAQRAVDYLSDREFPVQNVMIVGTDLKQVERVTGRLTSARVLASGAASGAWMGAFFGLLMWAFLPGAGTAQFLTAVLVGGVFGMIWALLLYRFTGGARDFTSVTQVVATRYEVLVEASHIGEARGLLEDQRRGVPADAGPRPQSGAGQVPPAGPVPPGAAGPEPRAPMAPGVPSAGGPAAPPPYGPPPQAPTGGPHDPPPYPAQYAPANRAPEPPKYRTYGEALDAERAARHESPPAPDAAERPGGQPGAQPPAQPGERRDDSAAEDAHDPPAPRDGHSA